MFNLTNKTAIVAGGGSRIEKATGVTFAKMGATVHILDTNGQAGSKIAKDTTRKHGTALLQGKNRGGIINLASITSSVGWSDRFAFSMTKGAVLTMTYPITKNYLANNMRRSCISPARVRTTFADDFIGRNHPGRGERNMRAFVKIATHR